MSAQNWKDLVQKLHCLKCKRFFTDPKVLPCLHLVCAGCLEEELSRSSLEDAASSSSSDRKWLQCPVCNEAVSVPLKLKDLITDVGTVRLVEMLNRDAKPKCQICTTNAAGHALCVQCRTLYCKDCLSAHGRAIATKNHSNVLLLQDMRTFTGEFPVIPNGDRMCPTHPTRPLDFYCQREANFLCEECISIHHKSHQYIKIDETFVHNEKKTLENMVAGVQQQIGELEKAADEIEKESVSVNKAKDENLRKIDEAFDSIQAILNQRKKQLQNDITTDANRRDKCLQEQKNSIISLLFRLRRCSGFTDEKLQQDTRQDIVAVKATILERGAHLRVEKSKVMIKPSAKQQAKVNFYGVEDIKKFIKQLGTFVSPRNCAVRNLKQKVAVNTVSTFSVVLRDADDKALNGISDQLHVKIQYYNKARSIATADEVRELRDGCYEVSYTPRIGGDHKVSVHVGGASLLGSPYHVSATLKGLSGLKADDCQAITEHGGKLFKRPCGISIGTNDEVVMIDEKNQEGIIFDQNLTFVTSFGHGSGDSRLNYPLGVAVGQHAIAVSEWRDHEVKIFSLQGNYLSKLKGNGNDDGQFRSPQGLCFNSKDFLFVADSGNHQVQVFNERLEYSHRFGYEGTGQLFRPTDIAISGHDQVYVADWSPTNSCVNIYLENGDFVHSIPCIVRPLVIALTPEEQILIDNRAEHKLVVLGRGNSFMLGCQGKGMGQFDGIQGIAVNNMGTVFITESGNDRLQVIKTSLNF